MDSDRVLVMDAGQAVELGHPFELLQKPGGFLRALVDHTGLATAAALFQAAEENFKTIIQETTANDTDTNTNNQQTK